jgi:hypothetical protein
MLKAKLIVSCMANLAVYAVAASGYVENDIDLVIT